MHTERHVDVLVVGAGGSGSAAAVSAAEAGASVLLISKDPIHCSDTKISEGNVTVRASGTAADSEEVLSTDMRLSGDDLGEPALARAFAAEARDGYEWLRARGLSARKNASGAPLAMPIPLGGHTLPRTVPHPNGGLDVTHALANAVQADALVETLEDAWCTDLLLREDGAVAGAMVYEASRGRWWQVKAGAVVLACGGVSTLYFPRTDTMRGNTGDAYALALRAGAALVDMEQIQFLPFGIVSPPSMQGLLAGEPASAGPLGVLRDADGNVVLEGLMARTRAECAGAIARLVAEGRGTEHGGAYLDLRDNRSGEAGDLFLGLLKKNADKVLGTVKRAMGGKAARMEEMWEVRPTAHYCMGGIRSTAEGQALRADGTAVPGLFSAGQALGGLHGSNRLGSTSLAEGTIFGRRAGQAAARQARSAPRSDVADTGPSAPSGTGEEQVPLALVRELQQAAWEHLGPGRAALGMKRMAETLTRLDRAFASCSVPEVQPWNQALLDWHEGRNMLLSARAIHAAAEARDHSVGAHLRLDAPESPREVFSVCTSLRDGEIHVTRLPRERTPLRDRVWAKAMRNAKLAALKGLAAEMRPRFRAAMHE